MSDDTRALVERLVEIFVPVNAPAVAEELRRRLSDVATLDYTAFVPACNALQLQQVETDAAVAAERERMAADLMKQAERTNMDFAEAMEWAAERIRKGTE